jgi:hypothetical protein
MTGDFAQPAFDDLTDPGRGGGRSERPITVGQPTNLKDLDEQCVVGWFAYFDADHRYSVTLAVGDHRASVRGHRHRRATASSPRRHMRW